MEPLSHFSLRKWFLFSRYGFLLYIPFILPILAFPGNTLSHISNGSNESVILTMKIERSNEGGEDTISGSLKVMSRMPVKSTYIILPFEISPPITLINEFDEDFRAIPCNNFTLIKVPSNPFAQGNSIYSAQLTFSIIPTSQVEKTAPTNVMIFQLNYNIPSNISEICKINNSNIIYPSTVIIMLSNKFSLYPDIYYQPPGPGTNNYNNNLIEASCSNTNSPKQQPDFYQFTDDFSSLYGQDLQFCYIAPSTNKSYELISLILSSILSEITSLVLALLGAILIALSIYPSPWSYGSHLLLNMLITFLFLILFIFHMINGINSNTMTPDDKVSYVLFILIIILLLIYGYLRKSTIRGLIRGTTIPEPEEKFLKRADREWIITKVTTIIGNMGEAGRSNLLVGILPNEKIGRINFRDGARNITEQMVEMLEQRGPLDSGDHALGKFLADLIDEDKVGIEDAIRLQAILSEYNLLRNSKQVTALRSRLQVSNY